MAITAQMRTDVAGLYAALFGRAPESDGLGYWVSQLDAGRTVAQIAQSMYDTTPARATYPLFLTNEEIVGKFYTNVLGRTADADGLAYWTAKLNGGESQGALISEMITAVKGYAGTDAAALTSQSLFNNKVDVGLYYAVTLGGNDVTTATTILTSVDSTAASVTAAKANADNVSGLTLTLTSTSDNSVGATANDTFVGVIGTDGTSANGTTFNAGDSMNGLAGTDTLNLSITGTNTGAVTTSAVTLSGIEKISVTNTETSAFDNTIDLGLATGVTTISVTTSSATGDTLFTNVNSIVAAEMKSGSGDLNIGYLASAVSGTSDSATLLVSAQTGGTFTSDGIETLTITSSTSANTVTVAGDSLTTINVNGSANLALGTLAATVDTVNASTATGKVTLTATAAVDYTLTGGAGNDTFTMTSNFDANDTVDGGSGTDTLVVAAALADTDLAGVSNVETLKVTGANAITLAANVSATTFDFGEAGDQILTLNTGYTNATTVKLTGDDAGNADKVVNSANVALTIVADAADIDATTTITGGTGTDTMTLASGGTADLTAVTGVESITITAGAAATDDATVTVAGADNTVASGKTLTVDASALTNAGATLTFVGTGETNGYFNVTGGAGNDTITGGTSGHDTLNGGAGNDSIVLTTLTANNVIDGGSGTDKLTVTTDMTSASVFAGVSNIETLKLGASTDLTTAATLGSITTIDASDASDNIITFSTGYAAATTVILTGDNANADKIVNSANIALTVTANADDIDATTTITGGTGTDVINLKANGGTATTTALTGIEKITVLAGTTVTDDVVITMGANDTQIAAGKTLTVDASALTDSGATLTFNGTTSETDGYLNVTGGAGKDTITGGASGFDTLSGGAGNDSLILTTLAQTDVVSGGDGTDSLKVTTDIASHIVFGGVTGVETLILGASTDLTLAGNLTSSGITTIDASDASDNIITFNSGVTQAFTVALTGDSANADKIVNNANIALTVNANDADIDATTTITGGTGTDTINLTATGGTATTTALTGVEKITVLAGTVGTETVAITMGANDTQIAAGKTLTIDASALTNSAATLTFTGTTSETDGHLVIIGGAGADTIIGGKNSDTITGGDGADVITISAHSTGLIYDTFTDASTGDVLNTADKGTEVFTTTAVTLGANAVFQDFINAAAAGDGSTNGIYRWFQFNGNTYVVEDVSVDATFVNGTDLVIELTGLKDLSTAAVGDHILTLG